MAEILKMLVAVLAVSVAVSWPEVSAETHHVVGGDGGWDASSSGRVFRVGDKISFTYPATEEIILELQSLEDFLSCNLNNPIRMYTGEGTSHHVTLEKEGTRYFTSANPDSCKKGLKVPVSVQPAEYDPEPYWPPPTPEEPVEPPPYWPPYIPEPTPDLPIPPPVEPSASPRSSAGFSALLLAAFAFCFSGL